jgi:hypothetical protein
VGLNPPKDLKPRHPVGVFFIIFFYLGSFPYIYISMKKYTVIFAIGVIFALTACGSRSTTNETTDSTATEVEVDTATTNAVDTVSVVEAPVEVK